MKKVAVIVYIDVEDDKIDKTEAAIAIQPALCELAKSQRYPGIRSASVDADSAHILNSHENFGDFVCYAP